MADPDPKHSDQPDETGTRQPWEPHEVEAVRVLYPNTKTSDLAAALGRSLGTVYRMADRLGIRKTAEYLTSAASGRLDGVRGYSSRFTKGNPSWNAGMKGWQAGGRSVETQFRKGRPACEAHNYKPVGTERINRDGYLERKVTDDPSIVSVRRWVPVHRLVWEAVNGPVPAGHVVCFLPGRRTTDRDLITVDTIELVHRADLARRNHPKNRSPELAKLIQLKGAITRQVNRIAKAAKEQKS
jgi:hypothetical protein